MVQGTETGGLRYLPPRFARATVAEQGGAFQVRNPLVVVVALLAKCTDETTGIVMVHDGTALVGEKTVHHGGIGTERGTIKGM